MDLEMADLKRKRESLNQFISNSYKSKRNKRRCKENYQIKKFKIQQKKRKANFSQSKIKKQTLEICLLAFLTLPKVLIEIVVQYSFNSIGYFSKLIDSFNQNHEQTTFPTYYISNGQFLFKVKCEEEQIGIFQANYVSTSPLSSLNFHCIKKTPNFISHLDPSSYNLWVDVDNTILYLACDYTIYILSLGLTNDINSTSQVIQLQCTLQVPQNKYKYLHLFKVSAQDQCIYCCSVWSKNVCIYNLSNGEFLDTILFPDTHFLHCEITDLALDQETNNLYLADICNDRIWVLDKKTKQYNLTGDQEWRSSEKEDDTRFNCFLKRKYKLSTPLAVLLHGEFLYINNDNQGIEIYSTSLDTFGAWVKTLIDNKVCYLRMYLVNKFLFVKCRRMHSSRFYVFQEE